MAFTSSPLDIHCSHHPMPESIPNGDPGALPAATLPASPASKEAYVREAKPSDFPALAAVYARAFARDPMMNWLGNVRALVPADHKGEEDDDAGVRRTVAGVRHFQFVLVKMVKFLGPIVVVVEKGGKGVGKGEGEGEEQERIVGGALWLPPGANINPSPLTLFRVSPWKSIRSWGLGVFKVCVHVRVHMQRTMQLHQGPPPVDADFSISAENAVRLHAEDR